MGEYTPGVGPLEADIADLQADVTTLQTDVTTLQTDVTALQGDVAQLETESLWLPAQLFGGTNGAPTFTVFGGATSIFSAWLVDPALLEQISANVFIPARWLTMAVDLWWTNQAAGAGDVRIAGGHKQIRDGVAMAGFDGTFALTATAPAQAVLEITTVIPSLANANGVLGISVQRDGGHAGDTLANDAAFVGVNLRRLT